MDDVISRKAAIDAIDKALSRTFAEPCGEMILKDVPSAQPDLSEYSEKLWKAAYERGKAEAQDEIVRCKDCRFYKSDGCFFSTAETIEDEFCSWAERRTDD